MNHQLKIKVCGMKFPQNIIEVSSLNPDFLGFIFHPSSQRHVNEVAFIEETNSIKKIGVFVNQSVEYIYNQIEKYDLAGVQLHGDETPDFARQIKLKAMVLKAFQINDTFDFELLKTYENCVDYFLFDTKTNTKLRGGTGIKFNWKLLDLYQLNTPFFLSGGIKLEDIEGIRKLNHQKLEGVDINSGFEDYPGFKNVSLIKSFINQIRRNE